MATDTTITFISLPITYTVDELSAAQEISPDIYAKRLASMNDEIRRSYLAEVHRVEKGLPPARVVHGLRGVISPPS